ncbi:hypothetical protein CVT26_009312 [Gymnopilus dilepis]|uniref:Reverse transcriptase domain-containing protein n=1 Tax=Gymnopilus dilepis TaxID=231916 RepID=A0A409YRM0_9AGAR|nr:hypothetical protein CVT26_009312 [Gymnopilus dilepis]
MNWIQQRKLPPADAITYNGRPTHDISCLDDLEDTPVRDWVEFAGSELDDALRACSNNSAPGPDHITWKHLKVLNKDHDVHHVFLSLANACLRVGCWPSTFKESLSVIIPKPGKPSYAVPKAYRPIVLLNTLGKLIEKMLSNRIQFDGINLDIFHPNQIGGVRQRSTEDAGIFLTHYVRAGWAKGLKTSVVAFDLAQFFPSLNHEVLLAIIRKLGFPQNVITFFESYLVGRRTVYSWNAFRSDPRQADVGVGQGILPCGT